jgi:hypothetical protein
MRIGKLSTILQRGDFNLVDLIRSVKILARLRCVHFYMLKGKLDRKSGILMCDNVSRTYEVPIYLKIYFRQLYLLHLFCSTY